MLAVVRALESALAFALEFALVLESFFEFPPAFAFESWRLIHQPH